MTAPRLLLLEYSPITGFDLVFDARTALALVVAALLFLLALGAYAWRRRR